MAGALPKTLGLRLQGVFRREDRTGREAPSEQHHRGSHALAMKLKGIYAEHTQTGPRYPFWKVDLRHRVFSLSLCPDPGATDGSLSKGNIYRETEQEGGGEGFWQGGLLAPSSPEP